MHDNNSKPVILVFTGNYLPGYKAGGPIRSISNIIDRIGDRYSFYVITRDRDLGDTGAYNIVPTSDWVAVGKASVSYLSPSAASMRSMRRLVAEVHPDLIYFNSFFDPLFTIRPLILRLVGLIPPRTKVVVAPRGEFSEGAIELKRLKKRVYMTFAKVFGLYQNVIWQACSVLEMEDIRRELGAAATVFVAENMFNPSMPSQVVKANKMPGLLRAVFVSRISPKKNTYGALNILKGVRKDVELHIYGYVDDVAYWEECRKIISELPGNVKVYYYGAIDHQLIFSEMSKYDVLFLPTFGENFGHVILEAMTCGLPAVISDRTPWRNLADLGVGWDLPLGRPDLFVRILEYCAEMDQVSYHAMSENARRYASKFVQGSIPEKETDKLFRTALFG